MAALEFSAMHDPASSSPGAIEMAAHVEDAYRTKVVGLRTFYEEPEKAIYRVEVARGRDLAPIPFS